MNKYHFDDAQKSAKVNSGGKIAYDHRPQSKIPNQQPSSDLGSRKPRPRIPLSVNRSKLSIPYKSEMCNLFQRGRCYYGENCHFAHNLSEIRQPAGLDNVAMGEHFGRNETGFNPVSGRGASDRIECRSSSGSRPYDKFFISYKTKLCAKWEERFGSCPYGDKCTYAHGVEELQEPGYYADLEKRHASSRPNYAEQEKRHDSRLMLDSRPSFAGSCKIGIETTKKEGRVHIMEWDIAKISEVYADWVCNGHDFHVSLRAVGS